MKEEITVFLYVMFLLVGGIAGYVSAPKCHLSPDEQADYVENLIHNRPLSIRVITANMTINEAVMYYDRYHFMSRGLLKEEIKKLCEKKS